jgi:hypothetical protein
VINQKNKRMNFNLEISKTSHTDNEILKIVKPSIAIITKTLRKNFIKMRLEKTE